MVGVDVLAEIRRAVRRFDLLPRGDTVVVGVSGGPDSLCLLHTLNTLRGEFGVELHVAHLNHGLRGAEADADAQFVSALAAQWGLLCTVARRDVVALAREHKLSIEEAA
ncbi:MAG TPA: ATP-binding protein, partial [Anaerolineae bacterium]|nr:ATP-binding protein [Anaerolineae bacterium]